MLKPRMASSRLSTIAAVLVLLLFTCAAHARAESAGSNILSRPEMDAARRSLVAERLREITGWGGLHFDADGALRFGGAHAGGSETAREMFRKIASGRDLVIIEDASRRADVVFCRVVEGHWTKDAEGKPPVHIILVDFADFAHVMGDRDALAAFNVGWGLLHEMSHVAYDAEDANCEGEAGECERIVNQMRRECSLAERAEYHFKLLPGLERSEFKTRLVRLAFVRQVAPNKKRRLWLMWDASAVGGL